MSVRARFLCKLVCFRDGVSIRPAFDNRMFENKCHISYFWWFEVEVFDFLPKDGYYISDVFGKAVDMVLSKFDKESIFIELSLGPKSNAFALLHHNWRHRFQTSLCHYGLWRVRQKSLPKYEFFMDIEDNFNIHLLCHELTKLGIKKKYKSNSQASNNEGWERERVCKSDNIQVWHKPLHLIATRKQPLAMQVFLVHSAHPMPLVQNKRS